MKTGDYYTSLHKPNEIYKIVWINYNKSANAFIYGLMRVNPYCSGVPYEYYRHEIERNFNKSEIARILYGK